MPNFIVGFTITCIVYFKQIKLPTQLVVSRRLAPGTEKT